MTLTPNYLTWPINDAGMPSVTHPKALDWGSAWGDSALLIDGDTRSFYHKNMRQVYRTDWTYDSGSGELVSPVRAGSIDIPISWTDSASGGQVFASTTATPFSLRLGIGMASYTHPSGGEVLVFPLGMCGGSGLAALQLAPNLADSIWGARETNLNSEYGYSLQLSSKWICRVAISDSYIFVSQGQCGIAVYDKNDLSWKGHLQMPAWQSNNLPVQDILVRRIDSKMVLVASVGARSAPDPSRASPKVLFYDADAIVVGDLATTYDFTPSMPSGTVAPIGVVFGSNPLMRGSSTWASKTHALDLAEMPNSQITTNVATVSRVVCAISNPYWTELHDVSRLLIANTVADGTEDSCSEAHQYSNVPHIAGLDVANSTPCTTCWLDTFAISSGPDGLCGPPAYSRTNADWPNLKRSGGYSVTLGGSYMFVGYGGNPPAQGNGFHVLAMSYDSNLANFNMGKVGIAQTQLAAGQQNETHSRMIFDSAANQLHGTIRASSGWAPFQLPPQADVSTLITAVQTVNGSGLTFEPQGADPSCTGVQLTAAYLQVSRMQAVPSDYAGGVALPVIGHEITMSCINNLSPAAWQLPANLTGIEAWNSFSPDVVPPLNEVNTHGGFEILGATVLKQSAGNIIFCASRSEQGAYAFSEDIVNSTMLEPFGFVGSANDIAVGPVLGQGVRLSFVLCSGRSWPYIKARYWNHATNSFGETKGRVPLCWPDLGSGPLFPEGLLRVAEVRSTVSPPKWRYHSPLPGDPTTHSVGIFAGRNKEHNYKDKFELSTTLLQDIHDAPVDSDGNIEAASALWRFKRNLAGTKTLIKVGDSDVETEVGMLEVQDVVQAGVYLLAWVNERDSSSAIVAHYVAVLKMAWTTDTGTGAHGTPQFVANEVTRWTTVGEPVDEVLTFEQVRLIPLTDFHIHDELEGNRLHISPDEKFVIATGGAKAGAYLLYLGADPLVSNLGYPKVVSGLIRGSSPTDSTVEWRSWPKGGGGLISDGLSSATAMDRLAKAPAWPLDGSPQNPMYFNYFPSNVGEFHQSNNALFLFLQTEPMSVWRVDIDAAKDYAQGGGVGLAPTEILHFLGALDMVKGRYREVVSTDDNLYWMGDGGAAAFTISKTALKEDFEFPMSSALAVYTANTLNLPPGEQ
jgi:hypothetical protein